MTADDTFSESSFIRLNVALLPPPQTVEAIVELAQSFTPYDPAFVVDGIRRLTHLTLYMAQFSSIAEVAANIDGALRGQRSFACSAISISAVDGGYVELGYEKTTVLLELQSAIVRTIERFAEQANLPPYTATTSARIASLKNHKYEYTGDSFRPHITLTRMVHPEVLPTESTGRLSDFSFTASGVVIGRADDQGSIREVLHSVNFGK